MPNLPLEILVHLFKYLSPSDRKSASATCQSWYLAANDYCFLKNKVAVFNTLDINEESSPMHVFCNSVVTYQKYVFIEMEISNKINFFWDSIGNSIKSLEFLDCEINEQIFINIIQKCINLEELTIECCRDLFISGHLLENQNKGVHQLLHLRMLSLPRNQYLTDALFSRLTEITPYLEKINLSLNCIQFHPGLIKKFYPPNFDTINNFSGCVFTLYAIRNFLEQRADRTQCLSFSKTLIDGKALKVLCEIPELKLKSLNLNSCDQVTKDGLMSLIQHQTHLCELNLGFCSRVIDEILLNICKYLLNIELLDIQRCRFLSDDGVSELHKLKKLKSLNISECELITSAGLINGLCPSKNTILRVLDIHSLNLDESSIEKMSLNIVNLRSLNMNHCVNAVTDKSIKSIFKNLPCLDILKISGCTKLTDSSFCSNVSLDHKNSFLTGTKGQMIVNKEIHDSEKDCITNDNSSNRDDCCLSRLSSIKELDISGCKNITDFVLQSCFNFNELVTLNLSMCQKITHLGINKMVEYCPAIENLNLSNCINMNDSAITTIVQKLKRLHYLKLKGCPLITDNTIEAIRTHCKNLKVLDIQGCRKLNPEIARSIETLILRTILISKPGPYNINII